MGIKRRLFKLGLLVLAGAIVNVAVAWGCAVRPYGGPMFPELTCGTVRVFERSGRTWNTVMRNRCGEFIASQQPGSDRFGFHTLLSTREEYLAVLPRWSTFCKSDPLADEYSQRGFVMFTEHGTGWPCLSMYYTMLTYPSGAGFVGNGHLTTPRWMHVPENPRDLPLNPIWPGFAINTVFYAAVLWVVFAGPGKLRRTIRIKRNQCPACAYPVGTSEVCTECGKPLPGVKAKGVEPT
jgi:hypothetical protein